MSSPLQRLKNKYAFLDITDIRNFDKGFFDVPDDNDYDEICEKFLEYDETVKREDKLSVCNKFIRNLAYLGIPGNDHNFYSCSWFTRWFYDQIESLRINYEFVQELYHGIRNNLFEYLPYIGECGIWEYNIIKKDPDNILKFYNFSSNFKEIKNYMKLGKSYTHSKAICDYLNECVGIYKMYMDKYKGVKCKNTLCEEINLFETLYEDFTTELSDSDYNIPPLPTSSTQDVGKFSLKQDIQRNVPARLGGEHQDRSIRHDNPTLDSQDLPPYSLPVRQHHLSTDLHPPAQQQLSPDSPHLTSEPTLSYSDPVTPQPTSPLTKTVTYATAAAGTSMLPLLRISLRPLDPISVVAIE